MRAATDTVTKKSAASMYQFKRYRNKCREIALRIDAWFMGRLVM